MQAKQLTRGALAKKTGCHLETIRYYENIGLMLEPDRGLNGYRLYGDTPAKRLTFIMRCRRLGFSLDETRGLLDLVDDHTYTCGEVKEITEKHLLSVQDKIADLRKMEGVLAAMVRDCEGGDIPACPVIDALYNGLPASV